MEREIRKNKKARKRKRLCAFFFMSVPDADGCYRRPAPLSSRKTMNAGPIYYGQRSGCGFRRPRSGRRIPTTLLFGAVFDLLTVR